MTNERIVLYTMLAIGAIAIIYFLRKVSPEISISGNRISIRKYIFPEYIEPRQIGEIHMIAVPEKNGEDWVKPIIMITFKFKLTNGKELTINYSYEHEWGGLEAKIDNGVSLKPETIKKIYESNSKIKLDEFTKDYIEQGNAQKFIRSFRG